MEIKETCRPDRGRTWGLRLMNLSLLGLLSNHLREAWIPTTASPPHPLLTVDKWNSEPSSSPKLALGTSTLLSAESKTQAFRITPYIFHLECLFLKNLTQSRWW